jgi:hypothetical protein
MGGSLVGRVATDSRLLTRKPLMRLVVRARAAGVLSVGMDVALLTECEIKNPPRPWQA